MADIEDDDVPQLNVPAQHDLRRGAAILRKRRRSRPDPLAGRTAPNSRTGLGGHTLACADLAQFTHAACADGVPPD